MKKGGLFSLFIFFGFFSLSILQAQELWANSPFKSKPALALSPSSYPADKKNLAKLLILRAKEQIERKQWKKAYLLLKKAQSLQPKNGEVYKLLADSYILCQNHRKALLAYRQAVKLEPTNPDFWMALGLEEEHLNMAKKALESFKEATLLKPTAQSWYHLGIAYMTLNRYNEALYPLEKANQLDPGFIDARHSLGLCYEKLGKKEAAHQAFSKAYLLNPTNAILQQNLLRITNAGTQNKPKSKP
ncbi:tetratricopeptide repeat protein [Methylacidiphilum caldifontis]|uniref:tetratricopeptide repeat protein n=1 Tax=Methylacidiphilum caldifontis TaxID=2795386 RepID=UPI00141BD5C8|nr:tetratricopeptide repeat protein [Methylacidiphilum caldifontis]